MAVFQSFLQGYQAGEGLADKRRKQSALTGAARAYKSGDTAGAAAPLLGAGMIDEANAYTNMGKQRDLDATNKTVGGQLAGGDETGAANTEFAAGNIEQGSAIKTQQLAFAQKHLEFGASAAASAKHVPVQQRATYMMQMLKGTPYDTPEARQAITSTTDWSDAALDAKMQQALTVKDQLEMQLKQAAQTESHRHNVASEGIASAKAGVVPHGFTLDPVQ